MGITGLHTYSIAITTAKTPRDLEGADRLVAKCREIRIFSA